MCKALFGVVQLQIIDITPYDIGTELIGEDFGNNTRSAANVESMLPLAATLFMELEDPLIELL